METCRHICFVIDSMKCGGMQRVAASLVSAWARNGNRVTLVTFDTAERDFFKLDRGVERIGMGVEGKSESLLERVTRTARRTIGLRRVLSRTAPDVLVSFGEKTNITLLAAVLGMNVPTVISERTDPRQHRQHPVWRASRYLTYRLAQSVVLQTTTVRDWAAEFLQPGRLDVIANPVDVGAASGAPLSYVQRENQIVGLGRLSREKGFDLLIEAFSAIEAQGWRLVIAGDGAYRPQLVAQVERLGIQDRVEFLGAIDDPFSVLRASKVFVLSSRYEGFPNALLEAMACGCSVVSFDCDSGPRDLIDQAVNGVLVPPEDVAALTGSLQDLTSCSERAEQLASAASDSVSLYSMESILRKWEAVFAKVART